MATFTEQIPQWIERIPQWVEGETNDTHWMECGWAELGWVEGDEVCPPLAMQWVECGWAENGWIEGDTVCPANIPEVITAVAERPGHIGLHWGRKRNVEEEEFMLMVIAMENRCHL